ncbi:MAG: hypothetical protein HC884_00235 [Chloroflexaceae bacterium]|nr:hypothetical protein [Chloroflexaceae bacterium]
MNHERPAPHTGRYAMHKYWSKKPHNLVAHDIQRFSGVGDIVLDAFCGSGVTIIESVRLRRRAIGIDINPVAVLMTRMGLQHTDLRALDTALETLRSAVAGPIAQHYRTVCPRCGHPQATVTHTIWNAHQPIELWVACDACRTRKWVKTPSEQDRAAALAPGSGAIAWYPTCELIPNSRVGVKPGDRVCDLFTPRALAGLSLLLQAIRRIEDPTIRSAMEFCFSATLPQASKMVFVIRQRGKMRHAGDSQPAPAPGQAEVGSWVMGYWVPAEHFEVHVWRCFEHRFRRMLRGKEEINRIIPTSAHPCESFEALSRGEAGYLVGVGTATNLPLPDEAVDYVFTDPPHGNRVPYLELSLMWNAWLGFESDWEQEVVISDARSRGKHMVDYQRRLVAAFQEYWRVLKPEKYLSVVFHSLDDATWLLMLNTLRTVGFALVALRPLDYSNGSVAQDTRRHALKTDMVITCQKPTTPTENHWPVVFHCSQEDLEALVRECLSRLNGTAATSDVVNAVLIQGISTGMMFKISHIVAMLERLGTFHQGHWYHPDGR